VCATTTARIAVARRHKTPVILSWARGTESKLGVAPDF
jgi:hypothetical protein